MTTDRLKIYDYSIALVLLAITLISVSVTIVIMGILGIESYNFFQLVPVTDFLFGTQWEPFLEPKSFGVLPLITGTLIIVIGSSIIAIPSGIVIAAYLNEYASKKTRKIIKPLLEILAGIPTVVYGYFALTFITPLIRNFLPDTQVFNGLSGAIVVGIMILPMISSLCDDAFSSLPSSLKQGGYALGAMPFEVVSQVIIPAAKNRIGASVILAMSRAIGETMAVTLAAGATAKLTLNPLESIQTMTAFIVQVSLGDTQQGGAAYLTCFSVAGLLFLITFLLNIVGHKLMTQSKHGGF
ncbi:MAG: phosphate ABC transporter permease subunit PstC [Bdellovibrionaceae bacterium]|jgi:phosphate transport system permease protein|nr:phosphate ABC transporter permease subunit PstC [Pseudobdellovibrionaceae bacterium]